jgi:hypothetical protein
MKKFIFGYLAGAAASLAILYLLWLFMTMD